MKKRVSARTIVLANWYLTSARVRGRQEPNDIAFTVTGTPASYQRGVFMNDFTLFPHRADQDERYPTHSKKIPTHGVIHHADVH